MTLKSWDELTEVEQLCAEYSDFHKAVHGCRSYLPLDITLEDAKAAMASLAKYSEIVFAEEAEAEKEAIAAFEVRVDAVIASGAKTREAAIRWIFEAQQDEYVLNDPDYFCHLHGLPYGYFKQAA